MPGAAVPVAGRIEQHQLVAQRRTLPTAGFDLLFEVGRGGSGRRRPVAGPVALLQEAPLLFADHPAEAVARDLAQACRIVVTDQPSAQVRTAGRHGIDPGIVTVAQPLGAAFGTTHPAREPDRAQSAQRIIFPAPLMIASRVAAPQGAAGIQQVDLPAGVAALAGHGRARQPIAVAFVAGECRLTGLLPTEEARVAARDEPPGGVVRVAGDADFVRGGGAGRGTLDRAHRQAAPVMDRGDRRTHFIRLDPVPRPVLARAPVAVGLGELRQPARRVVIQRVARAQLVQLRVGEMDRPVQVVRLVLLTGQPLGVVHHVTLGQPALLAALLQRPAAGIELELAVVLDDRTESALRFDLALQRPPEPVHIGQGDPDHGIRWARHRVVSMLIPVALGTQGGRVHRHPGHCGHGPMHGGALGVAQPRHRRAGLGELMQPSLDIAFHGDQALLEQDLPDGLNLAVRQPCRAQSGLGQRAHPAVISMEIGLSGVAEGAGRIP
ncbi:Uncharacterised protein [Burkholderia pseudomallei]|nr:Uncharacterised protein [Burkholderia pseudomallei]CAJ3322310.1 Uncharacterised protein [Burkholderia pseudomallei]CAJ3340214.1 Uncharacterised protein [Burkholderia pseudomallei]CAJ3347662.1 Uncharacterised protein [Burkholderia pseudomallei]CAJ3350645.1 Uncharacterised protein [Burkholderia pseudomallei]